MRRTRPCRLLGRGVPALAQEKTKMGWQQKGAALGVAISASILFAVALGIAHIEAKAQSAPDAAAEATEPSAAATEPTPPIDAEPAAPVEGALSDEELQALVAPIALYPDLVLVLALQASFAPLDIVQADRFLASYEEDPSLTPNPDWDESVIGLLNYPTVVRRMSGDLDWTQTLGTAVMDQLEGVQDAIQEIRGFMRAVGALETNDRLIVIVEGDVIRLEPPDENAVFIPEYDPEALLAALYSTAPAEAEVAAETGAEASAEAAASDAETEAAPSETAPSEEAIGTGQAEASLAPEPAPAAVPAAAPAYYPPPPVSYSDPSPSWLGTAATFAGGAAVGGLIGWAIADDDDDDDDDGDRYSRGNINIEDSNIVIGRPDRDRDDLERRVQAERLERQVRENAQRDEAKQELQQRYRTQQRASAQSAARSKPSGLAASGARPTATRPSTGSKELAARVDQAKGRSAPARTGAVQARPAQSTKAARPGDRKQRHAASAFGGTKSATQARRDSDRGVQSRSGARTEMRPSRSRNSGGAFAQHGGGKARGGDRGKRSRGGRR